MRLPYYKLTIKYGKDYIQKIYKNKKKLFR